MNSKTKKPTLGALKKKKTLKEEKAKSDKKSEWQKKTEHYQDFRVKLDQVENKIEEEFSCPDHEIMVRRLQNDSKWITVRLDAEFKNMTKTSVKWLYFLTYCKHQYCLTLKKILIDYEMTWFLFGTMVGLLYSTSGYLYKRSPLTSTEATENLKKVGMTEEKHFDIAKVLFDSDKSSSKSASLVAEPSSSKKLQSGKLQNQYIQSDSDLSSLIEKTSTIIKIYHDTLFS